jgi:hypothetical protein
MINYVKLTSNLTIERPEQTSNEAYLNGGGEWFNGNFSSSNANTLTTTCQYRKSGDSDWVDLGDLNPNIGGNSYRFYNLLLGDNFDYKAEYQFKITISDKLETIGNQTKDVVILSTGQPIVRIGKEKVVVNGKLELSGKEVVVDKEVACNYNDWQNQQIIEGKGAMATIEGFDTEITTKGGNILVAMSIPLTQSGGTCWVNLYVDGSRMAQYGVSHNVGLLAYTNVFKVSPGTHRVIVQINNNNVQTVTIYNYTSKAFTVAEI